MSSVNLNPLESSALDKLGGIREPVYQLLHFVPRCTARGIHESAGLDAGQFRDVDFAAEAVFALIRGSDGVVAFGVAEGVALASCDRFPTAQCQ